MELKDSTKQWLKDEVNSFLTTAMTFFAVDGALELAQVFSGNWSKMIMWQLAICLLRSFVKALLTMLFPKLFPVRTSKIQRPSRS